MSEWVPPGGADKASDEARAADAPVTDDRGDGDGDGFGTESGSVVRHEEQLDVGVESHQVGSVTARKRVDHETVREEVPRNIEQFDDLERTAPLDGDTGEVEVLPDGSVSIPILEEELVIQKRIVVRERVVVRKRTETRTELVETTVRKERVEVEGAEDDQAGTV